jgi:hypothetical protein
MKVLLLLCLAIGAFAARSNSVRHHNQKVQEKEFARWQLLTRARELDETDDVPVEPQENRRTGSFGSPRLGRVRLFKNNEGDNLRDLMRRGYAQWETYKGIHGESLLLIQLHQSAD